MQIFFCYNDQNELMKMKKICYLKKIISKKMSEKFKIICEEINDMNQIKVCGCDLDHDGW